MTMQAAPVACSVCNQSINLWSLSVIFYMLARPWPSPSQKLFKGLEGFDSLGESEPQGGVGELPG